jgi:ABC-type arginine/histidine transport system permease subunit
LFLWDFFSQPYHCAVLACSINHAAFVRPRRACGGRAVPGAGAARAAVGGRAAARYGLSACRNEVVLFFKGTVAVGAITLYDSLRVARQVVDATFDFFTPFVMTALLYGYACKSCSLGSTPSNASGAAGARCGAIKLTRVVDAGKRRN